MSGVRFRRARDGDAAAIVAIVNGAYRGTPEGDGWTTESHLVEGMRIDERRLAALMGRPGVVLVAEREGEVVACVHLEPAGGDVCELGLFAVRVDAQAAGLGSLLLEAAEAYARDEMGARCMTMHVVNVRDELVAWYERRGYERTGEQVAFEPDGGQRVLREGLAFEVLEKDLGG